MAEERQNEYRVSALTQLRELEKDGAVDTDEEAQKMLILEHNYKANARMIKTIDEMLQTILRI
jgi:flagellar hook-associated protein 1 FlgK